MSDQEVTVTLTADVWQALLSEVPLRDMTYTPHGEMVFAAYQAIKHAVSPDDKTQRTS